LLDSGFHVFNRIPKIMMHALKNFGLPLLVSLSVSVNVQAAVVLQYHHISEETPAATSISPRLFREHMAHLKQSGYRVLPLEKLVAHLRAGEALPDKAVAITFDDGYASVYTVAFPVLKHYGWPFTVFVNTKPLQQGLDQFIGWDKLREMASAGAAIANHSDSHPHLLRRQAGESERQWRQRVKEEILKAENTIAAQTGQRHQLFAYPYGEFDQTTRDLLAEMGFAAFGQHSGPLSVYDNLQALPRFPFGGVYGAMDDFKIKVASLPMPLATVEVRAGEKRLEDTVLPQGVAHPSLMLTLAQDGIADNVRCFASGQGVIPQQTMGRHITAQAEKPLPVGRSRYNCTAMSKEAGRYYWYSHFFIRKQPNGEWYAE
jgi:poly-beta-1,6-N-acetyl-D-glucosamine N-deacetylase